MKIVLNVRNGIISGLILAMICFFALFCNALNMAGEVVRINRDSRVKETPVEKKAEIIHLFGEGDQLQEFQVPIAGNAVIGSSYLGDGNFIVECTNCGSDRWNRLWFNAIGKYTGQTIVDFEDTGNYLLKIQGQGRINSDPGVWQIIIATAGPMSESETGVRLNDIQVEFREYMESR